MSCLSCCVYMTTNLSNPNTNNNKKNNNNNDLPPSLLQTNTTTSPLKPTPTTPTTQNNTNTKKKKLSHHHKPRQPSVIEIERAIGAGRFRDTDPRDLVEQKDVKFDMSTMSFPNRFEGSLQKQLREVGERMTDVAEKRFRSSGKKILKVTFLWILPIWSLSLLVASGVIKLPFSNQFLDQLIM